MKRNVHELNNAHFDVLVVGGGVYGASIAYFAALSGKKVALIEANDFASGTSSSMQRIIHGGLRYLQNANIKRLRHSVDARKQFFSQFPNLISPLACIVPTKGYGAKSRLALRCATTIYNGLSGDRNIGLDKQNWVPNSETIGKNVYQQHIENSPVFDDCSGWLIDKNITGGAIWYDGYCAKPERVVVSLLHRAYRHGAKICNHLEALAIDNDKASATGEMRVSAICKISKQQINISATNIINTTGAGGAKADWYKAESSSNKPDYIKPLYGLNIMVPRLFSHNHAMGFYGKDALGKRAMYFVVSQDDFSIIGTHWMNQSPVSEIEINKQVALLIAQCNSAFPYSKASLNINSENVIKVLLGSVPSTLRVNKEGKEVQVAMDKTQWIEHQQDGLPNFYSLYGVKYTTALVDAQKVLKKLDIKGSKARAKNYAGEIEQQIASIRLNAKGKLPEELLEQWLSHYGEMAEVLIDMFITTYGSNEKARWQCEIDYAVSHEMAIFSNDCYQRRLSLNSNSAPDANVAQWLEKYCLA